MHVDIEDCPILRLATVRHVGPYATIADAFERLEQIVTSTPLRPEALLGLFHDDPRTTPPEQLRSDAAVVVPADTPLPDGVIEGHVPAGRYAKTEHVGPYSRLGDVWSTLLHHWIPEHGYRLGPGVTYERYLNTPGEVPPEQLRTILYAPIA
jgi:AraC family transcriptional regulator